MSLCCKNQYYRIVDAEKSTKYKAMFILFLDRRKMLEMNLRSGLLTGVLHEVTLFLKWNLRSKLFSNCLRKSIVIFQHQLVIVLFIQK